MRFSSWSWKQWTSSIPSTGCLEGLWEFAQPVHMCFVDLEKAFERVPKWYSVGRFLRRSNVARGRRESGLGTTGFHLCFLQMMLSCCFIKPGPSACAGGGLQPSVKRLG
ncbi:hypothetical protein L3Q82_013125 [Scortum barcoo]|uniref:Uncharacterized protein n=1 Tax=Scortum barcoo TaxID=214431 RepID=A0ACB8VYW5_9TELE|nr:hypothetical protein L3Q82_013125 [Scortum barcoo]